ncbi:hypothetical protein RO3G_07753 [Rhizopus delemar RA 99-880]|uniref:Uncharacterized protein n=1 Tax=Rhizopus delemar (strain RA 99-880 / ATCC MYA-4621 / FGSC 9543 / NRRL 43880) TaxID=246409 RepID=I1C3L8_RHIO9|nr:hypothetical protein RO3G_07753 [Rhizopus delemar RA 99-880]|eukprot:EIE83048.1 hypothetical protein RO3G_07753 [Rhizopus delemar RA 99-880]
MADACPHAPHYPWIHSDPLSTFDQAVAEAKVVAEEFEYQDGSDDKGGIFLVTCLNLMPNEEATHVGYADAPGGIEVREGLNYNPYFPGDAIAMSRVLFDGVIEYEDGTLATTS